jgi:hypothetical protein
MTLAFALVAALAWALLPPGSRLERDAAVAAIALFIATSVGHVL